MKKYYIDMKCTLFLPLPARMMRMLLALLITLSIIPDAEAQSPLPSLSPFPLQTDFSSADQTFTKTGRGRCKTADGLLTTKDAYAAWGTRDWNNYEIRFRARTPKGEDQVQIWAGFREYDRNDRYIIALRGGRQNNLYLSRLGYMGADEFLALRDLDFHPTPGTWYTFRIQVGDDRIRVFLNDEKLPRIDMTDKNSKLAPSGKVTLGGGWITTEYDDLSVTPLDLHHFKGEPSKEYSFSIPPAEKERIRKENRASYQPITVPDLQGARTTISLDGQWLFKPLYELADEGHAVSPAEKDNDWHCMFVPDFWNPIRIWLHGETFGVYSKGVSDAYFRKETQRCENYTFDYKKTAAAWYRQWIMLPKNASGKDMELVFDAVSKVAEVWINGQKAGSHTGMFGEFKVDGSMLLRPGKNLIVVKVVRDFVKDISDAGKVVDIAVSVEVTNKMLKDLAHGFYGADPAGIWQPVKLLITDPLKITDVYIKPDLHGAAMEVTVRNTGSKDRTFAFGTSITDSAGAVFYSGEALPGSVVDGGEEKVFHYTFSGLQPRLWTPEHPHLYDFAVSINTGNTLADSVHILSGFRTFESKDGYLFLNGKRYWLRGGNQTPFALAPNDKTLADKFYDLMKTGNIEVTRTHTTPYNELWIDEADKKGIGISFEGTWPWLFLQTSMPDSSLVRMWADEFISLLKKYRNHPSILLWTVNNEMKFYDNDPDLQRAKLKMMIISSVVKRMRAMDPTRPVVFDSNYKRKNAGKRFGDEFMSRIDDGDLDDIHSYINWYDYTLFRQFKGEFQQENKTAGRPLISQEMSTGYPNAETGHATRFYTQVHQTAQALVGNWAYEYSDPAIFLGSHAFITAELAEALRRTNEQAAGILHFSLATWFRNVYDASAIEPYPVYDAMKRALQPVLVSAELWGRHFYTEGKLPVRFCVVNDREDGTDLPASELEWKLVDNTGTTVATGLLPVPAVPHYGRQWMEPDITIPEGSSYTDRKDVKLVLTLKTAGTILSTNEYKLLLAQKDWCKTAADHKKIVLVDNGLIRPVFDKLRVPYIPATSVKEALKTSADLYVFNGITPDSNDVRDLRALVASGGKLLLLDNGTVAPVLYPEYIRGRFLPTEGDIVNMDIPESPVFDGLEPMDLRYFNNEKREVPTVCSAVLKVRQDDHVSLLAKHVRIHGYLNGGMEERTRKMDNIQGETIVQIDDHGKAILSTMSLEKGTTDPVAGKLLTNMIKLLLQ